MNIVRQRRGWNFVLRGQVKISFELFQSLTRFPHFSSNNLILTFQTSLIIRVLAWTGTRIMTG
jgi:hypothetical protein